MWILLKYYNMYDQQGGYFYGAFDTEDKAKKVVDHIGRVNDENEWFELINTPVNVMFNQEI